MSRKDFKRPPLRTPGQKAGRPAKERDPAKRIAERGERDLAFEAPGGLDISQKHIRVLEHERSILKETLRQEQQRLSRKSFWYFVTRVLFPDTWKDHYTEEFHMDLCEQIQNLEQGKDLWLIIPREHRKSFIITIAHTLWLIICDPNIRILLVGARDETVKPFARLIRSAFVEGTPGFEKFQSVFEEFVYKEGEGGKFLKQSFQFECKLKTRTTPDPTFRATYLGVTGAGWRCDVLKYDDAVERRNVSTPEMSLQTLSKIMDLLPLVDTTSKYRNITGAGTRWAYHDPYGKIIGERAEEDGDAEETIRRLEERGTRVIVRHALEDPDKLCTHCPDHIVRAIPHGDPNLETGQPISFPIHSRETLLSQYERYLSDPNLGESMFWHQYMNVCMSPSNQKFHDEWFFQLHQPGFPGARRRVLAIDGAEKDFQRAGIGDYMVALFGEFDDTSRLCVVHGIRSNKYTKEEFQRQIITYCLQTNWWPSYVVKEKFGTDSFLSDLQRLFLGQSHPVFAHAETRGSMRDSVNVKKYDWIVGCLQGPMERGEIVWGSNMPRTILERARYELTSLGQVAHDDVADTLALFMVPKVRPKTVDRGPNSDFKWDTPTMSTYASHGQTHISQSQLDEMKKGVTILGSKDLDVQKAKGSDRVGTTFASLGETINWDSPDMEQSAFSLGDYE